MREAPGLSGFVTHWDYTSNLPVASQMLSLKLKWQIPNPLCSAKQAVYPSTQPPQRTVVAGGFQLYWSAGASGHPASGRINSIMIYKYEHPAVGGFWWSETHMCVYILVAHAHAHALAVRWTCVGCRITCNKNILGFQNRPSWKEKKALEAHQVEY